MIRRDYDAMILKRIEKSFDRIMPVCTSVAWISAVLIYFSSIPKYFVVFNSIIGLICLIIALFHDKMAIDLKITITIIIPIVIGILSFLDGGFASAGILLLIVSNVVAVMFLSKKRSIVIGVISVAIFIGLYVYVLLNPDLMRKEINYTVWIIHLLVFTLFLLILHTVVYSIRDYLLESIKELEDSVEQTYNLAYYDGLTGLPNLNNFKRSLAEKKGNEATGFLVILSIKNLNLINSIYSEEVGDEVLIRISKIFSDIKADEELLARIGGNEFGLWLDEEKLSMFHWKMKRYKEYFYNRFNMHDMPYRVEFNTSYMKHYSDTPIEDTYHKAKLALTYIKTHTDHGMVTYDANLENHLREDVIIKERLKKALIGKHFRIYYQTKVNAVTGAIVGVEALARLKDFDDDAITPAQFIPVLEKMHASVEFGEMIIRQVFKDFNGLCEKYGRSIKVSINISPSQLIDRTFVDFIYHEVVQHDLLPWQVVLEITEEIMIEDIEVVQGVLKNLKSLGFELSLDDFGSGYSSLIYLLKLDIDELKLDKSFVQQLEVNDRVDQMVEMVIKLAKNYGLKIVAEGVETKVQSEKLLYMGCEVFQGYYYSRPEPL